MQTVLILEYQIYVELVGPLNVGDRVSWGVDPPEGDFYGPMDDPSLPGALIFESDIATADDDDETPERTVTGQVKEIRTVWCRWSGSATKSPTPGTAKMAPCGRADRASIPRAPEPGLEFVGWLVFVE